MATLVSVVEENIVREAGTRALVLDGLVRKLEPLSHHREAQQMAERHLAVRIVDGHADLGGIGWGASLPKPFRDTAARPDRRL